MRVFLRNSNRKRCIGVEINFGQDGEFGWRGGWVVRLVLSEAEGWLGGWVVRLVLSEAEGWLGGWVVGFAFSRVEGGLGLSWIFGRHAEDYSVRCGIKKPQR